MADPVTHAVGKADLPTQDTTTTGSDAAARFSARQTSLSARAAVTEGKWPLFWCGYMFFLLITWGYDGMAGGIVVSIPQFRKDFGEPFADDYVITAGWQMIWMATSIVPLMLGSFLVGWSITRFGRKYTLAVAYMITIAGICLQYFSTTKPVFTGAKVLLTFPLGVYVAAATPYALEMAPMNVRGGVVAGTNFAMAFGQLLVYAVLREVNSYSGKQSYRILFAVQWGFVAVSVVLLPWLPESPYWLVAHGEEDAARKVLAKLYRPGYDVQGHLEFILEALAQEQSVAEGQEGYLSCFNRKNFKRTLVTCGVFFVSNCSGTLWVVGYMSYYFQLAGMQPQRAFDTTVGVAGAMVVGCGFGWYIVERIGRRSVYLYGCVALAAILFIIAGLSLAGAKGALYAQVAFMAMWAFGYQATIGTAQWAIAAEAPSSKVRTSTMALGAMSNTLWLLVWSAAMPFMVNPDEANLGGKIGFIFGSLLTVCIPFVYFCVPETKGRSFVEIDELWDRNVPPRKFAQTHIANVTDDGLDGGSKLGDKENAGVSASHVA